MNPQEPTEKVAKMLALLRAEPALAEAVAEVLAVVEADRQRAGTLDAAEERLVAPLRELGLHVLGSWARQAEEQTAARLLAGDPGARVRAKKNGVALRLRDPRS